MAAAGAGADAGAAAAAGLAAAASAIAAVAAAAVMCNCECTVMHVERIGRPNTGYILSDVQRGESVQKSTADRHS